MTIMPKSKHFFNTLDEVQDYVTSSCVAALLRYYNHERPHQANKVHL